MEALAVAVLQLDPEADPAPALASVPGARGFVLRSPDDPAPGGADSLRAEWRDRRDAAAIVQRASGARVVLVLEPDERPTAELREALAALEPGAPCAYEVARTVRFYGRDIDVAPVAVAWGGDPRQARARRRIAGTLVWEIGDLATTIAALDQRATHAARGRSDVGVADFLWRPAVALGGRLVRRWRHGVAGVIVSVLETYGEILTAAKVWEHRMNTRGRRRVPAGFLAVEAPHGWITVRDGAGERLVQILLSATPDEVDGAPRTAAGRGPTWTLRLDHDVRAVLRWYRRGGLLRYVVRDRFLGWRPRPMVELALTTEVRRRGVPVPEVLAARVDRLPFGCYRGLLVTREIEDAATLAETLRAGLPATERMVVLCAVGRAFRHLHDRGVHHRDLNTANILVGRHAERVVVHLIDFDRARLCHVVSTRLRRRALRRFTRSLAKLAQEGVETGPGDAAAFMRAYWEDPGAAPGPTERPPADPRA